MGCVAPHSSLTSTISTSTNATRREAGCLGAPLRYLHLALALLQRPNCMAEASSEPTAPAASGQPAASQTDPSGSQAQQGRALALRRPTAITRNGVRQFVETKYHVRFFLQCVWPANLLFATGQLMALSRLACTTHRNCVATVNLRTKPDLAHIATHARNAEYNPRVRRAATQIPQRKPSHCLDSPPCPAEVRRNHSPSSRAQGHWACVQLWEGAWGAADCPGGNPAPLPGSTLLTHETRCAADVRRWSSLAPGMRTTPFSLLEN